MKYVYLILFFITTIDVAAQNIPAGYCGVEFSYDAAGNRIKRKYVCANPNNGKFNVNFSKSIPPSKLLIFNANGKTVSQQKISGSKNQVDISHLPDGIYFISLEYFGKKITEKIIKMR